MYLCVEDAACRCIVHLPLSFRQMSLFTACVQAQVICVSLSTRVQEYSILLILPRIDQLLSRKEITEIVKQTE